MASSRSSVIVRGSTVVSIADDVVKANNSTSQLGDANKEVCSDSLLSLDINSKQDEKVLFKRNNKKTKRRVLKVGADPAAQNNLLNPGGLTLQTVNYTRLPSAILKDPKYSLEKNPIRFLNEYIDRLKKLSEDNFGSTKKNKFPNSFSKFELLKKIENPDSKEEFIFALVTFT